MDSLENLLHEAIQHGLVEDVQELIAQGADVNNTSLLHAVQLNMVSIAKILLQHGAVINCHKTFLQTPLHLAISKGQEMVEMLISNGAKIEAKDQGGMTPFHLAATFDQCLNLKILQRNGANIEAQRIDGRTPLMLAVTYAGDKTVEMLIQMGAKLDAKDGQGQTAMHVASQNGQNIMELSFQLKMEPKRPLFLSMHAE